MGCYDVPPTMTGYRTTDSQVCSDVQTGFARFMGVCEFGGSLPASVPIKYSKILTGGSAARIWKPEMAEETSLVGPAVVKNKRG